MGDKIDRTSINHRLEEILELHYEQLELIVFQHGVKPSQMEHLMEEVVHSIKKQLQLTTETSGSQLDLIEETLNVVNNSGVYIEEIEELEDEQEKRIFHFEEDEFLHLLISRLDLQEKSALILRHFHHLENAEIASLISLSEHEVQSLIERTMTKLKEQLDVESEEQAEKLLGLLKKSYARVRNLTNWETLIGKLQGLNADTSTSPQVEQKLSDKFSIWKPVLLISIIMVFFGSIIFVGETYGKVDDRYLSKLKEEYEEDKLKKIETLQIEEEAFKNLTFVHEADQSFQRMMTKLNRRIKEGEEVKREEVREEYRKLMESFVLPSEMVEQVISEALTDDKSKSEQFFTQYLLRLDEIKYAYYFTLYHPTGSSDGRPKDIDIPDELTKAMEAQNLTLIEHTEMESFPVYFSNERTEKLKKSIHPDIQPNIMILEMSDYMYRLNGDFDSEEIISTLTTLEKVIQTTEPYSELYHRIAGVYNGIIMWSLQDSWINPEDKIFGKDGTVKPKYRELWTNFANAGEDSPLSVLFKPIISEMEETGWKFSQKHEYFDYQNVDRAVSLARDGRLDEYSFNYTDYHTFLDPNMTEVNVDTESFESTVKIQYNDFKNMMDPSYFGGNDPLHLLGVYELARAEGNVEAVYNLTYKTMPFDEFKEQWEPGPPLFEGVESIKIDSSLIETVPGERPIASVVFNVNGKEEVRVKMVQINYYWVVSEVLDY